MEAADTGAAEDEAPPPPVPSVMNCKRLTDRRWKKWMENYEIEDEWIGVEFMIPKGQTWKAGTVFNIQYMDLKGTPQGMQKFQFTLEENRKQFDLYILIVDTTTNKVISSSYVENLSHIYSGSAILAEQYQQKLTSEMARQMMKEIEKKKLKKGKKKN